MKWYAILNFFRFLEEAREMEVEEDGDDKGKEDYLYKEWIINKEK